MKYLFYIVTTLVVFIFVIFFIPSIDDERQKVCISLYRQYKEELLNQSKHEIPLKEIDESCKLTESI